MAINLTQGWSAKTLVPAIIQTAPAAATNPATPATSSPLNAIMTSIFGPNYQQLLSTGQRTGGASLGAGGLGSILSGAANANLLNAKAAIFSHDIPQAQWQLNNAVQNKNRFSTPLGIFNPVGYENALSEQTQAESNLGSTYGMANTAALPDSFSPQVAASVTPNKGVGFQYNPFGSTGWVSSFNSGALGGFANPSYGSKQLATQMMSIGV